MVMTLIWAILVDVKRQTIDNSILRVRGFPLTHHLFELPAFLFVGIATSKIILLLWTALFIPIWQSISIYVLIIVIGSLCVWFIWIERGKSPLADTKRRNALMMFLVDLCFFLGMTVGILT